MPSRCAELQRAHPARPFTIRHSRTHDWVYVQMLLHQCLQMYHTFGRLAVQASSSTAHEASPSAALHAVWVAAGPRGVTSTCTEGVRQQLSASPMHCPSDRSRRVPPCGQDVDERCDRSPGNRLHPGPTGLPGQFFGAVRGRGAIPPRSSRADPRCAQTTSSGVAAVASGRWAAPDGPAGLLDRWGAAEPEMPAATSVALVAISSMARRVHLRGGPLPGDETARHPVRM